MERTTCDIVGTSLLQRNEVPHNIDNLRRVQNPIYGILWYHLLLFVNLFVVNILNHRLNLLRLRLLTWLHA